MFGWFEDIYYTGWVFFLTRQPILNTYSIQFVVKFEHLGKKNSLKPPNYHQSNHPFLKVAPEKSVIPDGERLGWGAGHFPNKPNKTNQANQTKQSNK